MAKPKPKAKPRGRAFTPEQARAARRAGLEKAARRKAAMLGLGDPGSPQDGAARLPGDPLDYLLEETPADKAWQARRMAAWLADPQRALSAQRAAAWQAQDAAQRDNVLVMPEASTPPNLGGHEQAPHPLSPSDETPSAESTLIPAKPKPEPRAGDGTPADVCPSCSRLVPPGGLLAHRKLRPDCDPQLAQFADYRKRGISVELHSEPERVIATCQRCGANAVIFLAGLERFTAKHEQRHDPSRHFPGAEG